MRRIHTLCLVLAGALAAGLFWAAPVRAAALTPPTVASSPAAPSAPSAVAPMRVAADSLIASKLSTSWSWYLTRASGLIATFLLVVLLLSGVGLLTGWTYKLLEPLIAWSAHRAVGLAFAVSAFIHVVSLLFDKFVGFTLVDLLVPFHSTYQPATIGGHNYGSLYMTLGIVALYAVAAIIVTSLLWINKKPRVWHIIHFMSYAVVAMVFFHGLFMGTDLKKGVVRLIWLAGGVIIVAAVVQRLLRAGTLRAGKDT